MIPGFGYLFSPPDNKVSAIISSNKLSAPFSLSSSFGIPIMQMSLCLMQVTYATTVGAVLLTEVSLCGGVWGRNGSHPLLVPREGCFVPTAVLAWPLKKGETSLPVCPRGSSDLTICYICFLPSAQEHCSTLKTPHQPCHEPLKFQSLSLPACKNSQKIVPLVFPVNGFGEVFSLCFFLVPLLSLSPLSL